MHAFYSALSPSQSGGILPAGEEGNLAMGHGREAGGLEGGELCDERMGGREGPPPLRKGHQKGRVSSRQGRSGVRCSGWGAGDAKVEQGLLDRHRGPGVVYSGVVVVVSLSCGPGMPQT